MMACAAFAARRAASLAWRAVALAVFIILGINTMIVVNDVAHPIREVFQPLSVEIPDFCRGGDPAISYARIIHKPVIGTFTAYYDTPERDSFPLLRSPAVGMIQYRPKPQVWAYPKLSAFMARHPDLEPGDYVAVVTWTFYRTWHSPQSVEIVSNPFKVKEC